MELRHIKLDYEEALSAKKQLLSTQLNLLRTAKKITNYKILRKKENIIRNKLKVNLTSLKTQLKHLQTTFPKQDLEIKDSSSTKIKKQEKSQSSAIQDQLKDIQKKLARLR